MEAAAVIADTYLALVDAWDRSRFPTSVI